MIDEQKQEKKSQSKYIPIVLIVIVAVAVVGFIWRGQAKPEAEVYKVGILQLVDVLVDVEVGFKDGMAELGYQEGENVTYVYRNIQGNMENLDQFAQELVDEGVDIIVSITTPSSIAAMKSSEGMDIPVVFLLVSDPVRAGLVESLSHPGGWVTGISDGTTDSVDKQLELLQQIKPDIQNVLSVYSDEESLLPAEENLRQAAAKLGLTLVEHQVSSTEEAIEVFTSIEPGEVDAIFMPADGMIANAQQEVATLSARDGLPHIYAGRQEGTLASYGPDFGFIGSQGSVMVDKILHGTDPASLPVELPYKYNLLIDMEVAEQIGITVPDSVLNIATLQ